MAKLEVGMVFRVQTKTKEDVFGDCIYQVAEVGLKAPEVGREEEKDGVRCIMLGGSGPSARAGYEVVDSEFQINQDIAKGITHILPKEQGDSLVEHYRLAKETQAEGSPSGTGVVEM